MNVQAVVVPGKGVAAFQAGVDGTHANQLLVDTELQKGTDPKRIIEILSADPAYQSRQFGILDLTGRSAGHSGLTNGYVSQDIQGMVPGGQIYYSIQGNILRPGEVIPNRLGNSIGVGQVSGERPARSPTPRGPARPRRPDLRPPPHLGGCPDSVSRGRPVSAGPIGRPGGTAAHTEGPRA